MHSPLVFTPVLVPASCCNQTIRHHHTCSIISIIYYYLHRPTLSTLARLNYRAMLQWVPTISHLKLIYLFSKLIFGEGLISQQQTIESTRLLIPLKRNKVIKIKYKLCRCYGYIVGRLSLRYVQKLIFWLLIAEMVNLTWSMVCTCR